MSKDELTIADVMTPSPVTVTPETPTAECLRLLMEHTIHHLPVVDGERVVGVLHAESIAGLRPEVHEVAGDLVNRLAPWAYSHEALWDVLGRCAARASDVCVVTDRKRRLLGILTERDIVRLAAERVHPDTPLDTIATTTLQSIPPTMTASDACHVMQQRVIRHLVVANESEFLGLLTLVRALESPDPRAPVGTLVQPEDVVTAGWTDSVAATAKAMQERDANAAIVVAADDPRTPDGLVTATDLLRALRLSPLSTP